MLASFLGSVLAEIIAGIAVLILGYVFRSAILSRIYNTAYWVFNSEIHLYIKRVDEISIPESKEVNLNMDRSFFEQLQKHCSKQLTEPSYSNNKLTVKVEGLPTRVNIILEERFEFEGETPVSQGYKLLVETNSELRVGYRSIDALRLFEDFSDIASTAILSHRFDSEPPENSIVICQLTRGIPAGISDISDDELNIVGHVTDSVLHLTFKNPRNLTKGVRKYFSPT